MPHFIEKNLQIAGAHNKTALLALRTPFQAWLAAQVIEKECIRNFDIIYFTQNDSPEDRKYYSELAVKARRSKYIFVTRHKFDIFNHLKFWLRSRRFLWGQSYKLIMLSSIESHVINAISNRFRFVPLVTFDDGTANYNTSGVYFSEHESTRSLLYRKLFGGTSLSVLKSRIRRHYTIQPRLGNIVSEPRLFFIDGWSYKNHSTQPGLLPKTYFLGAPFSEFLNSDQIERLETLVRDEGIDVYVRHPRETNPLELSVPFLEKNGLIAEDAIIRDSQEHPIRLIGSLSSVMFNLSSVATQRLVFVSAFQNGNSDLIDLARKNGCTVAFFE